MKIPTFALLAPLLAATYAAADSINDCGDSSFDNNSSGGSPEVSDCQQIAANIAGGGSWTLDGSSVQRQLVQYGTCAFGAWATGLTYIGNADIIGLIDDSISQFEWNGLVGASGEMDCQYGPSRTYWAIYHT
ncbi:putative necrosis-inducing factor-domain-containing protein [Aspergillus cavernicola]|uniref:Necrosis-inducing factor-domain-containing protein n=1 Tax=Aspergillus cavernicola TaxID=176166 RepID=A0ABR4I1V4_9EURO